jgi:hypothetical protein
MRRVRERLTYANVMATIAVFIALGGTALASVIITNNSQVARRTISGHKPPGGKHPNIIGGSVNSRDVAGNSLTGADVLESSLTGDTRKLIYNAGAVAGAPIAKIATVGPYTIKAQCGLAGPSMDIVVIRLYANGSAGSAQVLVSGTTNDSQDLGTFSKGVGIPAGTDTEIINVGAVPADYGRIGGTAMLKSGSTLVQVDLNAVADGRNPKLCFLYGTATRAT